MANVIAHPSMPPVFTQPIEACGPPDTLTAEERAVWEHQAPFALEARTLTLATALAFERYCRVVVLERRQALGRIPGGSDHRGLLAQLNQYERQFLLAPSGKPAADAQRKEVEAHVSKLARFRKV